MEKDITFFKRSLFSPIISSISGIKDAPHKEKSMGPYGKKKLLAFVENKLLKSIALLLWKNTIINMKKNMIIPKNSIFEIDLIPK